MASGEAVTASDAFCQPRIRKKEKKGGAKGGQSVVLNFKPIDDYAPE